MCKFDTMPLDSHPLAPGAKSNLVVLSYPDPETRPYLVERALARIQVYDIQVAVKGKYGPVFIAKTWLGKYDKQGAFTPLRDVVRDLFGFNVGVVLLFALSAVITARFGVLLWPAVILHAAIAAAMLPHLRTGQRRSEPKLKDAAEAAYRA
jgi:uncharacterized YccA/Bax inhibitor family protein